MPDYGETLPGTSEHFVAGGQIIASQITVGQAMTITSLAFRVKHYGGVPHNYRTALYSDGDGLALNVLTASLTDVSVEAAETWYTSDVPPYQAAPGLYWIAVLIESTGESFAMREPGDVAGQTNVNDTGGGVPAYPGFPDPYLGAPVDYVLAFYASGPAAVAPDLIAQMV